MIEGTPEMRNPREPINETLFTFETPGSISYSLQLVTNDELFRMNYDKPSLGIYLRLHPQTLSAWNVNGTVDADTIQNLGIPLENPRRRDIPPTITERDIERIQRLSHSFHQTSDSLWNVEATLPIRNMYRFFDAVWRPPGHTPFSSIVPGYHLGKPELDYRILPQKEPKITGNNYNKAATLKVQKLFRLE